MPRIYPSNNREASLIATLLKVEPRVTTPPSDEPQDYFARAAMTDPCGQTNTEADVSTYGLPPRFDRQR